MGAAKDSQKEPGMLLSSLALALAARATVKAAWMPSALSATFALPSETTLVSLLRRGPADARALSDFCKTCHQTQRFNLWWLYCL